MLGLAERLATVTGAPLAEIKETAAQVRRYFVEAMPLHVADEHELVVPRLRGRAAALDAALAQLEAEHHRHEPLIAQLIAITTAIGAAPDELASHQAELALLVVTLRADLTAHLAHEETDVFPAIRELAGEVQGEIRAAMRARRTT
jgi:iron-sulfur cluster repair protein YtfE (RIC family)